MALLKITHQERKITRASHHVTRHGISENLVHPKYINPSTKARYRSPGTEAPVQKPRYRSPGTYILSQLSVFWEEMVNMETTRVLPTSLLFWCIKVNNTKIMDCNNYLSIQKNMNCRFQCNCKTEDIEFYKEVNKCFLLKRFGHFPEILKHPSPCDQISDLVDLWVIKIKSPRSFAHVVRRDHVNRASENIRKVRLLLIGKLPSRGYNYCKSVQNNLETYLTYKRV